MFLELTHRSLPMVRLQALLKVADASQGPAGLQPHRQVDRLHPGQACLLQLAPLEEVVPGFVELEVAVPA